MRPTAKAIALCLAVLLLCLSAVSCRNRQFNPATPPADEASGNPLPSDFQCWVILPDGGEYRATNAAALYETVKKAYERSDTVEPFPDKEDKLLLIFCTGGTAPETTIPAYQLPNATLYGAYSLFPDDTGWYGDNLITAHVKAFGLKAGTYEALLALAKEGQ